MGGICTLISTPPNLIISGMYTERTGLHMNMFTPLVPGLFCLAVGVLAVLALRRLLPDRKAPEDAFSNTSDYTAEFIVPSSCRHGERLQDVPRQVRLKAGDTLLIECAPHATTFGPEIEMALAFFDSDEIVTTGWGTFVASLIMLAMVVLSALKIVPLLQSCFAAALATVVFRCCSPRQAMKSINWSILMIFAGSIVLGTAIQKTGLAEALANGVVHVCGPRPLLVMCAVSLVATFITELISNAAAGAMFCPIVYEAATTLGCDPLPFLVALMIAVSSSFATPIGSPTHMLVYGPGGYRFTDFLNIGFWMNLIILAANLLIVNLLWPIHAL